MIFRPDQYGEYYDQVVECGKYHKYWQHGQRNPEFDWYSGFLLDLKENKPNAVAYFADFLGRILVPNIPIAVVPGHNPTNVVSGLRSLVQIVAAGGRIDASGCLVRTVAIEKLATGGNRSVQTHLQSISIMQPELFQGRDTLLLDDITTTGNSLIACQQLLLQAGARRVQRMAFGKTC